MKTPHKHKHRAIKGKTRTTCFFGCVGGDRCNPAAHGNATYVDHCKCGARREWNVNGSHDERGAWQADD